MPATGGSIESVGLDGRNFPVAADAEVQRKLGGFENEVQANGDGTGRLIKTRVPLSIDGLTLEIDDDRGDQEFLQDLADRTEFWPLDITYASGVTYQGTAQIVGENPASSQNATAAISLMGPGRLQKQ
jgi:hypothetical protein